MWSYKLSHNATLAILPSIARRHCFHMVTRSVMRPSEGCPTKLIKRYTITLYHIISHWWEHHDHSCNKYTHEVPAPHIPTHEHIPYHTLAHSTQLHTYTQSIVHMHARSHMTTTRTGARLQSHKRITNIAHKYTHRKQRSIVLSSDRASDRATERSSDPLSDGMIERSSDHAIEQPSDRAHDRLSERAP